MPELKDYLNSINFTKESLMEGDDDDAAVARKKYVPYVVNRCMGGSLDTVLFANEMNQRHSLDNKMQYDFLLNSVRKKKRFAPWLKQETIDLLEPVKEFYQCSSAKAKELLNILTQDEIDYICSKTDKGGNNNERKSS